MGQQLELHTRPRQITIMVATERTIVGSKCLKPILYEGYTLSGDRGGEKEVPTPPSIYSPVL